MSGYCPQWVYSTCIGLVIKDFIEKDIPLDLLSRKYGKELSEKYDEINPIQMAAISEDIVILAEIEAGSDAVNYVNGFIYFIVNFETIGKVRSKNFFLVIFLMVKKDLNYDDKIIVRSFKAYMYSLDLEQFLLLQLVGHLTKKRISISLKKLLKKNSQFLMQSRVKNFIILELIEAFHSYL